MNYTLEVTVTRYYIESDESETWSTDPHSVETSVMEYNDEAREEYGSPVKWAVAMLGNERIVATPNMAGFPDLEPSSYSIGDAAQPHEWLSGTAGDNYTNEETGWSVYLTSPGWTPEQRAEVFRSATA